VILTGDLNVAHEEIDLKNPKTNHKTPGFTNEEREGMTNLLADGFTDSFWHCRGDEVKYSFWSTRTNGRATNTGWRLDYFITSNSMKKSLKDSDIHTEVMGSDHCPISLEFDLT